MEENRADPDRATQLEIERIEEVIRLLRCALTECCKYLATLESRKRLFRN